MIKIMLLLFFTHAQAFDEVDQSVLRKFNNFLIMWGNENKTRLLKTNVDDKNYQIKLMRAISEIRNGLSLLQGSPIKFESMTGPRDLGAILLNKSREKLSYLYNKNISNDFSYLAMPTKIKALSENESQKIEGQIYFRIMDACDRFERSEKIDFCHKPLIKDNELMLLKFRRQLMIELRTPPDLILLNMQIKLFPEALFALDLDLENFKSDEIKKAILKTITLADEILAKLSSEEMTAKKSLAYESAIKNFMMLGALGFKNSATAEELNQFQVMLKRESQLNKVKNLAMAVPLIYLNSACFFPISIPGKNGFIKFLNKALLPTTMWKFPSAMNSFQRAAMCFSALPLIDFGNLYFSYLDYDEFYKTQIILASNSFEKIDDAKFKLKLNLLLTFILGPLYKQLATEFLIELKLKSEVYRITKEIFKKDPRVVQIQLMELRPEIKDVLLLGETLQIYDIVRTIKSN